MNELKPHPAITSSILLFSMPHNQLLLFPSAPTAPTLAKPVNVASVPQRSPFRYPGGKTWFVPTFRKWLYSKSDESLFLVEPFVGGGIISLTALLENLVSKAIMVELDSDVAAVWQAIVDGYSEDIAKRILDFDLTTENVMMELPRTDGDITQQAFQTILKNRTFHGGILADGSGFLKYGENGKGIRSRWYPETLAKRFRAIETIAHRIVFLKEDGLGVMTDYSERSDAIFFIDPPYTAGGKNAGRRLYRHYQLDHERLFDICASLAGDFLMTYDNADEVRELAEKHNFATALIPMKNTHHATMKELVIGKNLEWL